VFPTGSVVKEKRISDATQILQVVKNHLQAIYTNDGNCNYIYRMKTQATKLQNAVQKMKRIIKSINIKKSSGYNLISRALL
jgi:hypothetical protein